jgi:hypothetical protein
VIVLSPLHDYLNGHGYRLIEDCWEAAGRRTYIHDDNADRSFLLTLVGLLIALGWSLDKTRLRTLLNEQAGELIEVEPGGSDTTGHFLHHLKSG